MIEEYMLNRELETLFKELKNDLDTSFDKINNLIDQVFILDSPISKINNPKFELSMPKLDQFNFNSQSNFQSNILQQLKPLINSTTKDQIQTYLQSDQHHSNQSQQSQITSNKSPSSQFDSIPFTYQIMKDNSIKEDQYCYVIAINKDSSIVAVGCYNQIKIYKFKQGMMKQVQILNQHNNYVFTLNFMKKSNQLISGDNGGSIVIWQSYSNNEWNSSQTIKGHSSYINCLILNNNEDLFISSSSDSTIKFWIKQNEWTCQQTITDHTSYVFQLSLNEQQDKVISCECDNRILVIEYSEQSKMWIVKQNIKVDQQGYRLCFINNDQFTFQPRYGNLMHVYEMNSVSKQFTKTKHITINQGPDYWQLFSQQFIKQKQILVNKHYQCVNLIRKTENNEFKVEQSIQFNTYSLFGQLSNDGQYLITWDDLSKEIQIRKYQQQQ